MSIGKNRNKGLQLTSRYERILHIPTTLHCIWAELIAFENVPDDAKVMYITADGCLSCAGIYREGLDWAFENFYTASKFEFVLDGEEFADCRYRMLMT